MFSTRRQTEPQEQTNFALLAQGSWKGLPPSCIRTKTITLPTGELRYWKQADVLVTKELATAWLENCKYEGGRPVEAWNRNNLIQAMEDGTFMPGAVQFSTLGTRNRLNDFNHRLSAISSCGISQPSEVWWFECATEEEVEDLYRRTDRGKRRDPSVIHKGIRDRLGLNRTEICATLGAVKFVTDGFRARKAQSNSTMTDDRVDDACERWESELSAYFQTIRGSSKGLAPALRVAGCVAVGIVTFRYQPKDAAAFWTSVKDESSIRTIGSGTLSKLLQIRSRDLPGSGGRGDTYTLTRAVAECWNAWLKDRKPKRIDPKDLWKYIAEQPRAAIEIGGTPFNGKTEP